MAYIRRSDVVSDAIADALDYEVHDGASLSLFIVNNVLIMLVFTNILLKPLQSLCRTSRDILCNAAYPIPAASNLFYQSLTMRAGFPFFLLSI